MFLQDTNCSSSSYRNIHIVFKNCSHHTDPRIYQPSSYIHRSVSRILESAVERHKALGRRSRERELCYEEHAYRDCRIEASRGSHAFRDLALQLLINALSWPSLLVLPVPPPTWSPVYQNSGATCLCLPFLASPTYPSLLSLLSCRHSARKPRATESGRSTYTELPRVRASR